MIDRPGLRWWQSLAGFARQLRQNITQTQIGWLNLFFYFIRIVSLSGQNKYAKLEIQDSVRRENANQYQIMLTYTPILAEELRCQSKGGKYDMYSIHPPMVIVAEKAVMVPRNRRFEPFTSSSGRRKASGAGTPNDSQPARYHSRQQTALTRRCRKPTSCRRRWTAAGGGGIAS